MLLLKDFMTVDLIAVAIGVWRSVTPMVIFGPRILPSQRLLIASRTSGLELSRSGPDHYFLVFMQKYAVHETDCLVEDV